ncbi:MAG TPA: ABC transporter permease [Methylomirabilota bacterium]|jgi:peptide/nickel transport system permease protein|nr:ABC transporter permease [Methylomirabilota bacterium]
MSRRLRRYPLAVAGALVLIAIVGTAALAPHLPLTDPDAVDTRSRLRPPLTPGHLLGTDEFGRDLVSRLVWGARVSLLAGVATAAAAMLLGVVLGVVGGYYTGVVETVIMRATDVLMAFPYILLAIAIVAGLGPGLRNAMLAIAVVGFPLYTRLVRGVVLSVKQLEFVEAARALGSSDATILRRHVLPQFVSPVLVTFSLDIGAKILATAGLSFLGLGTQPPTADWGSMLATGRQFVVLSPHVVLLPGVAIFVVVFSVNLVGDALRDVLDPRTYAG